MVVFDSADLDSTVEGIVDAIWFNQGQVSYCTCTVKYIFPRGAYLISGPKKGGLIERGGLISNHKFSRKFTVIFETFTITPLTKTEQEMGYASPVLQIYAMSVINNPRPLFNTN